MANVIYGGRDVERKFKRFLDVNDGALIATLLAMWQRQSSRLTDEQIAIALQAGIFDISVLNSWEADYQKFTDNPMVASYVKTFPASAVPLARAITRFTGERFVFDPTAIYLQQFIANKELKLAGQLNQTQINGIRKLLTRRIAFEPISAPDLAREIQHELVRQGIGLTEQKAIAPKRTADRVLRQELKAGRSEKQALERAIKASKRHAASLLRDRASIIARSEMAQAWSWANHEVTQDAFDRGLFGPGVRLGEEWLTGEDERVCNICEPLNGTIKPLNGTFTVTRPTKDGPVPVDNLIEGVVGETKYVYAHSRCRCTATVIEL